MIIILLLLIVSFSHNLSRLSNCTSPQLCRTLLSILADFSSAEVGIVSILPLISSSCSLFSGFLRTLPNFPVRNGITVNLTFYNLFFSLARSRNLSSSPPFFSLFNSLERQKSLNSKFFFLLFNLHLVWSSGWSLVIRFYLKDQRILCFSFLRTDSGLCIYHLSECANFNILHNSHWIPLSTQSCLFSYFFWVRLLHSLIMW